MIKVKDRVVEDKRLRWELMKIKLRGSIYLIIPFVKNKSRATTLHVYIENLEKKTFGKARHHNFKPYWLPDRFCV